MKKLLTSIFLLVFLFSIPAVSFSQDKKPMPQTAQVEPAHKVVFQLATGDTVVHKQLMKQLNNILTAMPGIKIEVVCQGPGLDMLTAQKTLVAEGIHKYTAKGVTFNACEFSMKERKVERDALLQDAGTVPFAMVELISRQEQGWSCIKLGY